MRRPQAELYISFASSGPGRAGARATTGRSRARVGYHAVGALPPLGRCCCRVAPCCGVIDFSPGPARPCRPHGRRARRRAPGGPFGAEQVPRACRGRAAAGTVSATWDRGLPCQSTREKGAQHPARTWQDAGGASGSPGGTRFHVGRRSRLAGGGSCLGGVLRESLGRRALRAGLHSAGGRLAAQAHTAFLRVGRRPAPRALRAPHPQGRGMTS